jgi:2,3-bisphosphoglycerate-independent phosphoglycerate mutase
MSLIFIFLDGIGLAPAGPDNPLTVAGTPALSALLGGPLTIEQAQRGGASYRGHKEPDSNGNTCESFVFSVAEMSRWQGEVLFKGIDAALGMPGLPQSGTGQTALLAGVNAAALHGRHQPHFPPVALRPLLAERNVLRRVVARGGRATFANAFGPRYWEAVAARRIRRSASVIAAEGAGLRFRDLDDLRAGRAIAWDVTGAALREHEPYAGLPFFTPHEAGANLAHLADDHDLVFYESFLPDLAGHGRLAISVGAAMALLDGLIGGALATLRPADSLLITSDHGNIESVAAPAHTRNPVPLLVAGPAARAFAGVESIVGVADVIDTVIR